MSAEFQEDELVRCVALALERIDDGLDPNLQEVCGGRPELEEAVARAVGLDSQLPHLQVQLATRDAFLGTLLGGRYAIDQRLGAGAMGVVYRANDKELGRSVAVKILYTSVFDEKEAELRFEREAESLASIEHESVVAIYDRGRTETGMAYLVMGLVEGCPLDQVVEHATESDGVDGDWLTEAFGIDSLGESSFLRIAVRWAAQLAQGLHFAHDRGVFHRDVKPSNIIVRHDGCPVLIDFGTAAREHHATLSGPGSLLGTPAFLAPESLEANAPPSRQRDVYGLAATLYNLLGRRAPYTGTPSQVLASLTHRDPEPIQHLCPGIPRDLRAILERGLARNPGDRYTDAAALADDLHAFLEHRPVSARPSTALGRGLRRIRTSPAWRAGIVVASIALFATGYSSWNSAETSRRESRAQNIRAHFPPALTLWSAASRVFKPEARLAQERAISEVIALRADPFEDRLVRACFRHDQGDLAGAAADMEAIAQQLKTPFLQALAAGYRRLPKGSAQASDLDLTACPEPTSARGRHVKAHHLMRVVKSSSDIDAIQALLAGQEDDQATGAELSLLVRMILAQRLKTKEGRLPAFRSIHDAVLRLEAARGSRSAMTAHILGTALLGQNLYEDARQPLLDGRALSPSFQGFYNNLGVVGLRTGRYQDAIVNLMQAIALRPHLQDAFISLIRVHLRLKKFDEARAIWARAPFGESQRGRRTALLYDAEIDYRHSAHLMEDQPEEARALAQVAVDKFDEAVLSDRDIQRLLDRRICNAIATGSLDPVFIPLLERLETEPSNWELIGALIQFTPATLTEEQTEALKAYFIALQNHHIPKQVESDKLASDPQVK